MNYRFSYAGGDAGIDDIVSALKTHGLAIVTNVLDDNAVSELMNAIEPEFNSGASGPSEGEKFTVQAVPGLLGIDPIYAETLLLNSLFLGVADRILTPHCHNYRVQISTGMRIPAGGTNQFLHREMDIYRPFLPYDTVQAEYGLFAMWAGTDFTFENGATRLVPGSHLWDEQRSARDHEIIRAEMPAGSVAMWLGMTLHAGAANKTQTPRTGFLCALGVDWLIQQENQLLTIPPEEARKLPEKAQRLLGYQASPMYGWARGRTSANLLVPEPSASRYVNAGLNEP